MTLVIKLIQRTGARVFCGFERLPHSRVCCCVEPADEQFTVPIFRNLWQGLTARLIWSVGPCLSISGNINAFDDVRITEFYGSQTPLKMLRCQQVSRSAVSRSAGRQVSRSAGQPQATRTPLQIYAICAALPFQNIGVNNTSRVNTSSRPAAWPGKESIWPPAVRRRSVPHR